MKDTVPTADRLAILRSLQDPHSGTARLVDLKHAEGTQTPSKGARHACPCFTPGTRIATHTGEVPIEKLAVGDRVITRDCGLQIIRWIGCRSVCHFTTRRREKHLAPIRIRKGALGNDLPERDMLVSPNHRMLVSKEKTALEYDGSEVLVAAKHLVCLKGVDPFVGVQATYIHLMFDQHQLVLANGAWSESFQPDLPTVLGIGNAQRIELLTLFPQLATQDGIARYSAVRPEVSRLAATFIL